MIFFWMPHSSASPISTPRSPRATINRITGADQAVEGFVVSHRFGALDLGHQPGSAAGFVTQLARVVHVIGITREGHGQVIQLHLGSQFDVGFIFLSQGWRSQAAATAVDTLMVGQRAADDHFAVQGVCGCGFYSHHTRPSSSNNSSPTPQSLTRSG